MILYFSGTGNSRHAAEQVNSVLQDEMINLNEKIKNNDNSPLTSEKPWIIAAPVYCWQLPRVVRDWIINTEFCGSREIYFVLTCGSDMGNGEKYLKNLCREKNLVYKGAAPVVMPENYIAMFDVPDERESEVIIKKADRNLARTVKRIQEGQQLDPVPGDFLGSLKSGIVNAIYYPLMVKDNMFYAEDFCTGCGLCAEKCPLNNVVMENGKPSWKGNCTHCMACISYCPAEAIEYGRVSKGKRRYNCE